MACNKLNRIWCETRKPKNKKKGEKMKQKRETRTHSCACVCVDLENCEQRHKKREKCISSRGTVSRQRRAGGEKGEGELGTEVDVGEWKVKNLKGHKLINH